VILAAPTDKNQGNFRPILRYRAKWDELLKNALDFRGTWREKQVHESYHPERNYRLM
jgi:hypothetical protein